MTTPTMESNEGGFLDASRVNSQRSMLFFAIGALVGLGIAGVGLFNAAGTATRIVPPENVATVNQRPIMRSDLVTQLETEMGMPFDKATRADKLKVLDEMVREELLVQRALELDFAETDQDARNALVSAVSQQIVAEVTTSQPTDAQLKEYYESNKAKYASEGTLTARNLVLPTAGATADQAMAKAKEAAAALATNAPIAQIVQRFGLKEEHDYGEDFYFAARIHLGDALFAKATALDSGAVSEPFVAADGIHIVKVIQNAQPVPLTFERARQQVLTDCENEKQMKLMDATLKFLRSRAKILVADDYADDYKP